jgi:hypothetical protein
MSKMFGGEVSCVAGGYKVACGLSQEVHVLTPRAVTEHDSSLGVLEIGTPVLAGIALATRSKQGLIPAAEAHGMFIEWIPA